ncbi:Protein NRT1/ PTR FAMILY 8.2, partial [Smittium mucronatum]
MADIEKFYDHPEVLINGDGYMQEQPADFIGGVPEPLHLSSWFIISTELCERFTYYGASLMFAQYLRNELNMKKTDQVSIIRGFTFFCYFTTLFGAFIADQYLGKYITIAGFASWYVIGTALLSISALTSIERSVRLALFIVSTYVFIGVGTGGIKSNVSVFVAEQVKTGYKATKIPGVYIDSRATIERCYRYFYLAINIGGFAGMLLCPQLAKNVNYFTAYVVPAGVMAVGLIIFIPGYSFYVKKPVGQSPFVKVYRTI